MHYFNNDELEENDTCNFTENTFGQCKNIEDCRNEFEKYKSTSSSLKVCKFGKSSKDDLICCPVESLKIQKLKEVDFTKTELIDKIS